MNTTTNNHNTHQGAEGKDAPAHQHGTGTDVEHDHRHLGGLKAALHNPNVSADAKEDAARILIENNIPLITADKHDPSIPIKHAQAAAEEHQHRVLGGYKATMHNPRASEEAKVEAADKLEKAGAGHKCDHC